MAYVQEYAQGKYRARKKVAGKLVSKSFSSKAEAWAWAEAAPDDDQHNQHINGQLTQSGNVNSSYSHPVTTPTLLSDFVKRGGYIDVDLRESTRTMHRSIMTAHILPTFGSRRVDEITHAEIQAWVNQLKLQPSSVRNVVLVLRRLFDCAVRARVAQSNPVTGVVQPRMEHEEMRFLTVKELERLADAMNQDSRVFVYLAGYAGLRIGEVFGLCWSDVDLFRSVVNVRQSAVDVNGRVIIGPPKTKAGRRAVPIPQAAVCAIRDHQTRCGGVSGSDAFVMGNRVVPLVPREFRRHRWAPAVKAAGLAPLRPHDLRHTAVSLWIAAGITPKEIAARAGHTSVQFSLDRYGHLYPTSAADFTSRLDALISKET